jgi:methyl-accepting chemotaxis protein
MNENKANYAKIGFFVLTGFALIFLTIGIAGARVFNKQVTLVETYFTESVTGLDIGSPVKYRGVPVGEVSRIGFVFTEYSDQIPDQMSVEGANQILVVMALDPKKFAPIRIQNPAVFLDRLVQDGLRVKVAALGLTGLSYLELDYFDGTQMSRRSPPIFWRPKYPLIPSAPSTMLTFKKSIDDVFVKLSQINIQALGDELLATLYLLQSKMVNVDIANLTAEAGALFAELRKTNRSIHELVSAPELKRLPDDMAATAGSARRVAATVEAQLEPLVVSVHTLSDRASLLADTLTRVTTNTGDRAEQTLSTLSQTLSTLNQTAQTLNRTATSQQTALADLIQNLRSASAGLDRSITELRANPSALLFGRPPEPLPETTPQP